jgi:hypothetical protein
MAPLLMGIISTLVTNNLPKLAQAVVDKGVDYVSEKTGIELKPDMPVEDLSALRDHELKWAELEQKDRDGARHMQEVALAQDDVFSKRFIYYLASFWSVFAVAYILAITFLTIPENSVRFADTILGFLLGTIVATILQFFFGSSKSSKDKTDAMMKGMK